MNLSVIIPTHNPDAGRLARTIDALRAQTLPLSTWELIIVDNASTRRGALDNLRLDWHGQARLVREDELGLTPARRRGLRESRGTYAVLVDDDNLLAPEYLERTIAGFQRHSSVGALGGKSLPEFENPPEPWHSEFLPLLALRDLGAAEQVSSGLRPDADATTNRYPPFAPMGAGMGLRRAAVTEWLGRTAHSISDRQGAELTSGGDNDIVLSVMKAGWEVAYLPDLVLTHLISAARLEPAYLARLNRGIQKSWMEVLALHEANPWAPLSRTGAMLRKARAWLRHKPWQSPAAFVRWQGACGHFDGRVSADDN